MLDELGPIAVGNGALALEAIPIRHRASIMQAFFRARCHAAQDLFSEVTAIILGGRLENCLENNTLVALADIFHCGKHRNAVLLELVFIEGAVVSVTGETVEFPDDNAVELPFFTVVDHALKIWPLVCFTADRAIGIDTDDHEPAPLGIGTAIGYLIFNTALALVGAAIPGVDNRPRRSVERGPGSLCGPRHYFAAFAARIGTISSLIRA